MGDLMMKGASHPAKVMFEYRVGDDWATQWTIEHGEEPSRTFLVTFDLKELTPEQRRQAIELAPVASRLAKQRNPVRRHPVLPAPTDDPDVVLNAVRAHLATVDIEDREPKQPTSQEDFLERMVDWAAAHGSARLKRAIERGYRATGIYLEERARQELPDFVHDPHGEGAHREALNPSEVALDLEEEVLTRLSGPDHAATGVRIVWLLQGPSGYPDEALPGEAIFVDLLGKAPFFRPVTTEAGR